jgi:hypothetical protein
VSRPKPTRPTPDPPAPRRRPQEDALAARRDALQLLPLADDVQAQPGTHLRVLFQPAFHSSGCLTLHLQGPASTVEVVLERPARRDGGRQESDPPRRSPGSAAAAGELYWAAAPVPAAVRERFQEAIAGIALAGLGDRRAGNGRDGMLIDGEVVADGVVSTFAAWSPTATQEPDVYQVCQAVLDLGRACLPDEPGQTGLIQIQGYLHSR